MGSLQSILLVVSSTLHLVSFQVQRHKIYGECLSPMAQNNCGMNLVEKHKSMTNQVAMFRSQLVVLFLLSMQVENAVSLPAYLSTSSLGQFNFSMNMNVTNISNENLVPEVLVITANSGLFTTIAGSSQVQTALLNKEMVVDTSTQDGADDISSNEYN